METTATAAIARPSSRVWTVRRISEEGRTHYNSINNKTLSLKNETYEQLGESRDIQVGSAAK